MTVSKLINEYLCKHPHEHFFDRDTLKFFGERISEMRVLQGIAEVEDYGGEKHKCYVLSSLQRNAPAGARRVYHYFDTKTFENVIPAK